MIQGRGFYRIFSFARSIARGDLLHGIVNYWTWIAIAIVLTLFVLTFRYMMSLMGY